MTGKTFTEFTLGETSIRPQIELGRKYFVCPFIMLCEQWVNTASCSDSFCNSYDCRLQRKEQFVLSVFHKAITYSSLASSMVSFVEIIYWATVRIWSLILIYGILSDIYNTVVWICVLKEMEVVNKSSLSTPIYFFVALTKCQFVDKVPSCHRILALDSLLFQRTLQYWLIFDLTELTVGCVHRIPICREHWGMLSSTNEHYLC